MSVEPRQILDLLGLEYIERHNRLSLCCPLHHDTNPSAGVYTDTNLYHCYACELTLPLVDFYARVREITVDEAKKELFVGMDVEEKPRIDRLAMKRLASGAERKLEELRQEGIPLQAHAALGEVHDKILVFYKRGKIDRAKMEQADRKWYNKVEEVRDGLRSV